MMNPDDDFSYYQIVRTNIGDAPDLMKDFSVEQNGCDFLNMGELAAEGQIAHLKFGEEGAFRKLDTDYFNLNLVGVFLKKIVDALSEKMPIKGLQLVPAVIKDNRGKMIEDYWVANIYQRLLSFDEKKSVFGKVSSLGRWSLIEKIAIDKEKLCEIPLKERLVYVAKESSLFQLYHRSIVDIIENVKPKGFVFVPVEEWYPEIIYEY